MILNPATVLNPVFNFLDALISNYGVYAEFLIMPSRSWKASIYRGFADFYSALSCQGSVRRMPEFLR
jgi:hypothetical protein